MAERRAAYPPEYRRQMVELVRAGRRPGELVQRLIASTGSPGRRGVCGQDAGSRASTASTAASTGERSYTWVKNTLQRARLVEKAAGRGKHPDAGGAASARRWRG